MMSDKPQVVKIVRSMQKKLEADNRDIIVARERMEADVQLARDILADLGTPVPVEEYDLYDLSVGFVLRQQPEVTPLDVERMDAAETKRQTRREKRLHANGVVIPDPEPEEEEAV
jgi:hypothetical protein